MENKKKLTKLEMDLAIVAANFLEKGNPEYRIAKHFVERGMTPERVHKLLNKLNFSIKWKLKIYEQFKAEYRGQEYITPNETLSLDDPRQMGKKLRNFVWVAYHQKM